MWPERRPGPRLRRLAGEAFGRARVDDLCAVVCERHAHVGKERDGADIHVGGELSRRPLGVAFFQRPAFGFPLRQPAVEDVALSSRRKAGTSTTRAPPNRDRRCRRRRRYRRRRCRARRPPRRIASGRAAYAAGRSNDRRPLRCRRTPRRGYGPRDIRRGRRAAASAKNRTVNDDASCGRANARRAIRSRPASGSSGRGRMFRRV